VITLDTSGVLAVTNRRDRHHLAAADALRRDPGPFLVPAGALAEITFMLERWIGISALEVFLGDLAAGLYTFDCADDDFLRIRELVHRYADLPLGAADASVIACAERSGGRVLTLDRRDFDVVARELSLSLLPPLEA